VIDGMSCVSCAGRVERALTALDGVRDASVNLANGSARLDMTVSGDLPEVAATLDRV